MKIQKPSQTVLADLIIKAKAGDARSSDAVVLSLMPAAEKACRALLRHVRTVELDDALGIAMYAIHRAVGNFDASKGYEFVTYALTYVKNAVRTEISKSKMKKRHGFVVSLDAAMQFESDGSNPESDRTAKSQPYGDVLRALSEFVSETDVEILLQEQQSQQALVGLMKEVLKEQQFKSRKRIMKLLLFGDKSSGNRPMPIADVAKKCGVQTKAVRRAKLVAVNSVRSRLGLPPIVGSLRKASADPDQ